MGFLHQTFVLYYLTQRQILFFHAFSQFSYLILEPRSFFLLISYRVSPFPGLTFGIALDHRLIFARMRIGSNWETTFVQYPVTDIPGFLLWHTEGDLGNDLICVGNLLEFRGWSWWTGEIYFESSRQRAKA
jgi:hypothetical protein